MENVDYNINGGFPPIEIINDENKNKNKLSKIEKERGFSNAS